MMKRCFPVVFVLFFAGVLFLPQNKVSGTSKPARPEYAEGRVLVKLRAQGRALSELDSLAGEVMPAGRGQAERLAARDSSATYLMRLGAGVSVEEGIAAARANPDVEFAEPDYLYYPADTMPDDPFFNFMWDMLNTGNNPVAICGTCGSQNDKAGADIGATQAWDITTGDDSIVVGITDTGIDISHPDFTFKDQTGNVVYTNIWTNPADGSHGFNFVDNNTQVFDPTGDSFHGTHVAGTIGAVGNNNLGIAGVAWHVKLMPLKFIGPQSGSTSDAIRAIQFAVDQKNKGVNVRAINASWDGPKPAQALHDAILAASEAGILFICAAGNSGLDLDDPDVVSNSGGDIFPAAFGDIPALISVAALDRSDGLASCSNFGHSAVAVAAPGDRTYSTMPGGGYGCSSGTSMAAPHVTGAAVLLAAQNPSMTALQIKQRIIATSQTVIGAASKVTSSGRINAFNALTNTMAPLDAPAVNAVSASKKIIVVDGLGFLNGSAVIEVNGTALSPTQYDPSFLVGNGTMTELGVKLGKPLMNQLVPRGTPVTITVFNPTTGQRSGAFQFTR